MSDHDREEEPPDPTDAPEVVGDADVLVSDTPYLRLRRQWINERSHVDLLPYATEDVMSVAAIVQQSADRDYAELEQTLKQKRKKGPRRGGAAAGLSDDDDVEASTLEYPLSKLYALESDRLRYLLADYHRTRVHKITKFYHDILLRHSADGSDGRPLLSPAELVFARSVADADAALFGTQLSRLPQQLQDLYTVVLPDGTTAAVHPRPPLDTFRVFMAAVDGLVVHLPAGAEVTLNRGDIAATALEYVNDAVREGRAVLL